MGNSNNNAASSGVGALTLLGIAFVVLKLCGVIDWSWWWVTAPFWIPAMVGLAIVAVAIILYLILDGKS